MNWKRRRKLNGMWRKLRMLLLYGTTLGLSACAHGSTERTTLTANSGEYCRIAKPIAYDSSIDSPETVAAVEAHNSAWVCVCEGDCPKVAS